MRSLPMFTVVHLLGIIVVLFGAFWLVTNISGLPEYRLVIALAAISGLVFNHFRWCRLGEKIDDRDMANKVNHVVVANYMVLFLFIALLDFGR